MERIIIEKKKIKKRPERSLLIKKANGIKNSEPISRDGRRVVSNKDVEIIKMY